MEEYWNSVALRLKSLGKAAVDRAVPVFVRGAYGAVMQKACDCVEEKLNKFYADTIRNTLISFALNMCGVLLLACKPFGVAGSRYAGYTFFAAAFAFFCVRVFLYVKNYGKLTLSFARSVVRTRSIPLGAEDFVLNQFPAIALVYAGIDIASEYVSSLREVPLLHEMACLLIRIFWKRVAVFTGILCVYTVTVLWILRPMLIARFA